METGVLSLFRTPVVDVARFPAARGGGGRSLGLDIDLLVGRDLTSRLAVSLFASGTSQSASSSYGAFDLLAAGLDARYAFYALKDRNGWERFFVYAHLRGGYLVTHPRGLFGNTDTLVAGGLGADYYTQLRHFAVGLRIDGLYVLSAGAPGLAITPTVRYTF
jgi:hypothetical protein